MSDETRTYDGTVDLEWLGARFTVHRAEPYGPPDIIITDRDGGEQVRFAKGDTIIKCAAGGVARLPRDYKPWSTP